MKIVAKEATTQRAQSEDDKMHVENAVKILCKGSNPRYRYIALQQTADKSALMITTIEHNDGSHPDQLQRNEHLAYLDPQNLAWFVMNVDYRTTDGGVRRKVVVMSWVPDSLQRETHKATIKEKVMVRHI